MKNILYLIGICFFCSLNLISCSGSGSEEKVATGNIQEMLRQIDKAMAKGNYAFAFKVVNAIPSCFGEDGNIYYDDYSYDFNTDKIQSKKAVFTLDQYIKKAVEVLKTEADVLLSKDDPDAENLFLEHLADFELGANTVNVGEFSKTDKANIPNEKYQQCVTTYNDYLISVIRKALIKSKPELAQKVSNLIRDGLSFKIKGNGDDEVYIWSYDTEAKDEAKELIDNYNKSN